MKNSLILVEKQQQEWTDPRVELDSQALTLANRNAFPVVAQQARRKDGMGLAVGIGGALLLGGITFASMSGHRQAQPARPAALAPVAPGKATPVAIPPQAITQVPAGATPAPGTAPSALPVAGGMPMVPPAMPQSMTNAGAAPTLIVDTSAARGGAAVAAGAAAAAASGGDAFGLRSGGGPEVAAATRMNNPGFTVAQGTLIPAVLETAINSDLPGYARAVVSADVRSFDGSRVLVPRSSRLIGQYKGGVAGGQTRAYVMWTRLIRPDGVSVQLASPAVDESGATGLVGSVNNHFMKRFGSALLLSVVGTASTVASGGTSLILSGGESAASVAAARDGQIPPTIKVRQGQPIRVFTAKDLDFSTVSGTGR
jgi:type IV secretion system protein VirB10